MVDTVTTASGTSVSYPPGSMMGMSGWGNGNCAAQAAVQGEHFLAHLITNDDRHNGEHHILNRLSQIQSDIPTAEGAVQSAISAAQNSLSAQLFSGNINLQSQASTYAL